jgi:hypothetical protein
MRTSFRRLLALVMVAFAAIAAGGASVAGSTISVPADYSTLKEALQEASSGDVIEISRTTLRESISVRNLRDITIRAERETRPATLIGRYDTKPVLELINCRDLVFENLIIQSGSVGIQVGGGQEIIFRNCVVEQNYGTGVVGYDLTLESCRIQDNLGWGVELIGDPNNVQDAQLVLIGTTIENNQLGGFRIQAAVATAASSTFTRNAGYGMFVDGQAVVTFDDKDGPTRVSDNSLGGILVQNAALTLRGNATVAGNLGVGIRAENAQLTLDGTTVSGHEQPAVLYVASQGSVLNSVIQDNAGVGLRLDDQSVVTVSHSTVARQGGNGIEVVNGSTATVAGESILTENKIAGLFADATSSTVSNATVTKNAIAGIRLVRGAQVTAENAFVVENALDGIQVDASTLTVTGGLVSKNGQYGVLVTSGGMATIGTAAVVSQNGADGVRVEQGSSLVQGAEVSSNRRDGVSIVTGVATAGDPLASTKRHLRWASVHRRRGTGHEVAEERSQRATSGRGGGHPRRERIPRECRERRLCNRWLDA